MPHPKILLPLLTTFLLVGCSPSDDRLIELATQSAHEQARQNERMAQGHREIATATKHLVEADAQSRSELIGLQADLQASSDQLELERQQIAKQRHRDPIIAAAISEAGTVLACLLPLVLCAYLLKPASTNETCDELVVELLAADLEMQRLLPPAAQGLLEQKGAEP